MADAELKHQLVRPDLSSKSQEAHADQVQAATSPMSQTL